MSIKSICVIGGHGSMGSKHVKRLQEEHPELEVFIEDPIDIWENARRLEPNGERLTVQNYADAYIIATPSETHYEIAKSHLKQGHNILLEKPLTLNHEEAKELYDLAQEKDAVFLAGHTQRFNPVFNREISGPSDYQMIEGYLMVEHDRPNENVVFDLMIHLIELACYLCDYCNREDIEIIDAYVNEYDETVAILFLDDTVCSFTVKYGNYYHMRDLVLAQGDGVNQLTTRKINLLDVDKEPTDSLQHMHDYFIEKCNENIAIDHAKYGVQSVKIVEEINSFLENA